MTPLAIIGGIILYAWVGSLIDASHGPHDVEEEPQMQHYAEYYD